MRNRLLLCLTLVLAATAWAVPVEKWVQTTHTDFESGKAKGTAILSIGKLVLAPQLKPLLEKPVQHIWALAATAKGDVFAATGTDATLLHIEGDKAMPYFKSPNKSDIEILSVAVGADGAVYAAAAPSGTIFRITAKDKATVLHKCADPYVWALAVGKDKAVYAATGPKGKLLKITPDGKAKTLLTAKPKHLLSLALAPDGSLYTGTDAEGLLYKVAPDGSTRIVYDAAETDIRAVVFDPQGHLYFATAATKTATTTQPATTTMMRTIIMGGKRITVPSSTSRTSTPSKPSAPGTKISATNVIYRLDADGDVTKLAKIPGVLFYALAWHDGHLFAGTGNDGKLYRIDNPHPVLLADLDDSQITALTVAGGRIVAATANSGRLYRVSAEHMATGTLTSEVYDASAMCRWGSMSWQATTPEGTAVTVATRTGNVKQPDDSWSPWSDEKTESRGTPITSPLARFIQYRATLKTTKPEATPMLDEVILAYVQANRKPEVSAVKLMKPPKPRRPTVPTQPGQRPTTTHVKTTRPVNTRKQPAASQRGPFAERIRIMWQAADPNKDQLVYSIYFRGEDETTWKKLKERLPLIYLDWDTHAVPDGPYRIRVVASDLGSNPPDQALEGKRTTEAFMVDNTPPAVAHLAVKVNQDSTLTVTAQCTDAGSGLAKGEYSIDAGPWTPLVPTDGIFDSHAEAVAFKTKAVEKGEHTLVVRAKDEAENSGAAKSVFVVK